MFPYQKNGGEQRGNALYLVVAKQNDELIE
jgi:hypothetical protein